MKQINSIINHFLSIKYNLLKSINYWLFYGLGKEEYDRCMEKVFSKNIINLRRTNIAAAVLLAVFIIFPVFIEKDLIKTLFFAGTSVISIFLYVFVRYKFRQGYIENKANKRYIYTLILLSYVNVIFFGIYMGIWANPGEIAGSFLGILLCALFLFNISPVFHLCLTVCSMVIFILLVIIFKTSAKCGIDIPNALFAGVAGIILGWQITMNRFSLASVAGKMEDERNNYFDQCTVDELTQLKNRRDFINTFQRSITNYRQSDNFLCIAILDIDFFKNYNDHYGHLEGDECLRKIGKVLKELNDSMNIYAARIGGEEFALIWFEHEAANVKNIASRINSTIYNLYIPHEKSKTAPFVTVSIGIHVVRCGVSDDFNTLYRLADEALYTAKRNGRNCAVISRGNN
jgi:diguanylate cyclase (GGDEF)-like protein